jgi:hypothetical protein
MGEQVSIRMRDGEVFTVEVPDAWGAVMLYKRHDDGGVTVHTESGNSLGLHPDASKAAERWLREYLSDVDRRAEAQTAAMLRKVLRRAH